jgi:hypothetical protein
MSHLKKLKKKKEEENVDVTETLTGLDRLHSTTDCYKISLLKLRLYCSASCWGLIKEVASLPLQKHLNRSLLIYDCTISWKMQQLFFSIYFGNKYTIPAEGKGFFSSPDGPDRLWGPSSLLFNGYRGNFAGVKRSGREVNHSPPSSVNVRNGCSYTPVTRT